ncbi:hypothetical protein DSO57_1035160 [Entomophthora muscae]|uniref:Uncharacterized protein n=1 Tax=Entomophthora muscae TaxID=34485 RepID=A0ACC2TAX3_9FUNG|nr:hypothetical protein DSO57_1035160 [Entomophthora muscae]
MKLVLILGFALGSGLSGLLSQEAFYKLSDSFAKNTLGTFGVTPARCNSNLQLSENGDKGCFVALVGTGTVPMRGSSNVPMQLAAPIGAIFYAEKSIGKTNNVLDYGVDAVQLTMAADPKCTVARYDMEKLADTLIGGGSISITDSDSERVSHGWKVGTSVTYKTPFDAIFGGASLTLSADYSGSIATTTTSSVGLRFDVSSDTTCTPYLMRYSVLCNAVSFRVQYFKNGTQVYDKLTTVDASAKPFLMPINQLTSDFFKVITGCIDLTA